MATITSTIKLVDQMTPTLNKISKAIDRVNNQSKKIGSAKVWSGFNTGVHTATKSTHSLYHALRRVVFILGTLRGLRSFAAIADTMMSASARINNINDGLYTTSEYLDIIYQAAQRSRGSFSAMVQSVGKLGTVAGDAFNNVNEMVAFTELMNKLFVISGASATEASSAMYQLTQAMAAGRLQGDEMRSIMENAPLLAQKLADYLGVTKGEIKELGAEGVITADIIKNALFGAADEINDKFEDMPKTIGQVWTEIKNHALNSFRPVIERVQQFINSPVFEKFKNRIFAIIDAISNAVIRLFEAFETPRVQSAIDKICGALGALWEIAKSVANFMASAAIWIADNWSWIAPTIYAVVTAMLLYKVVTAIASFVSFFFSAGLLAINAAGAVTITTLGWIVLAVFAVIFLFYHAISVFNAWAGTSVSATGLIFGAVAFAISAIVQFIGKVCGTIKWFGSNVRGTFEWLLDVISIWASNVIIGMQQLCEALPGYWEYFKAAVVAKFWGIIAGAVGAFNSLIQGAHDTCVKMLSPFADFANGVKNIINWIKNAWNGLCDSLKFSIALPDWLGGHKWEWNASGYKVDVDNTPITAEGWIGKVGQVSNSVAGKYAAAQAKANLAKSNVKDVNWSTNALPEYGDYTNWGDAVDWTDWQKTLDAWDKWYGIGENLENGVTGVVDGIAGLLQGLLGGSNDKVSETNGNGVGRFDNLIPKSLEDLLNGSGTGIPDTLGSIADNTGSSAGSAGNIEDTLDLAEEELELLRKLAEQEVINRFTTAEIHVDMTNNNNISSGMDLDGIVTHLSTKLYEELGVVASGVHY